MLEIGLLVSGGLLVFLLGLWAGARGSAARLRALVTGAQGEDLGDPDELFALARPPRTVIGRVAGDAVEVQTLYERIGFSPVLEKAVAEMLRGLRSSIHVDVPDYDAFVDALRDARDQMRQLPDRGEFDSEAAGRRVLRAEALLDEVWALRDTPAAVVERLEERPVEDQLPYVEQVPVAREGAVHWRTPVRVSLLRKRPRDPIRFRRRLDRLSARVETSDLERPANAETDLRAAIGRLRKKADEDTVYVPTLLLRIEEAAWAWLEHAPRASSTAQKEALDERVLGVRRLGNARPTLVDDDFEHAALRERTVARYREDTVAHAKVYVNEPEIHNDWLTDALLAHLLTTEMLAASGTARERLRAVVEEVHARNYDPRESRRRLRALEDDDGFVQSLAYALLRLRQETATARTA